MFRADLVLIVR